jgi:peptidoglycan/xylan/chitin deacetylase (PgdA/CDA1 family)
VASTALVIIAGFALIFPLYLRPPPKEAPQQTMLVFSIMDTGNVTEYCKSLSSTLHRLNVNATVFFSGKAAEHNPDAVSCFGENIDIGSQTYSYVNLTSISDYTIQLEEVRKGKAAVDEAGNLYSRLFKAPYRAVDQNIYSLLIRSDIIADFSYENQYNLYRNGEFLWFDANVFNGSDHSVEFFLGLPKTERPLIISFDNTQSVSFIDGFLSELFKGNVEFVSASRIAQAALTIRGG